MIEEILASDRLQESLKEKLKEYSILLDIIFLYQHVYTKLEFNIFQKKKKQLITIKTILTIEYNIL